MGHPGLIYRDGFQYAYASFYAITIPFTGVLFLKRQWMLGKRFGFITPGEMMAYYFRSDAIRILVVLVALIFPSLSWHTVARLRISVQRADRWHAWSGSGHVAAFNGGHYLCCFGRDACRCLCGFGQAVLLGGA